LGQTQFPPLFLSAASAALVLGAAAAISEGGSASWLGWAAFAAAVVAFAELVRMKRGRPGMPTSWGLRTVIFAGWIVFAFGLIVRGPWWSYMLVAAGGLTGAIGLAWRLAKADANRA
jgi:hypothetical protein